MKKLMFAGIAALCATVVMADGEISSANVVGYTTKEVTAGKFYLIGTQFDKAGTSSTGSIDMNDLLSLSETITAGEYADNFATAPQIQVLNAAGTGYDMYFYISDGTYDDGDDTPLGFDAWCDEDGYELTDAAKLAMGKGFWFKSLTSGTITAAGQVSEAATTTLNFPANKFTILCNPYPAAVALQSLTTSATPGEYADNFATAPQIQVLNAAATGYDMYFYISDGTYDDGDDTPLGFNAWCNEDGYELEGTQIGAGAAFWIKAPTAGSVTFSL